MDIRETTGSNVPEPLRRAFLSGDYDRLLTLHDLAARLGCPPVRVKNLTADRILRVVEVGRSLRWSNRDLGAFVKPRNQA